MLCASSVSAATSPSVKPKTTAWKAVVPEGYAPITWAKAPGVASFFKAPTGNGALDFLTRIYLPQNQVQFIFPSSTPPVDWGMPAANFATVISEEHSTPAIVSAASTSSTDGVELSASSTPAVSEAPAGFHNFAFDRFVAESAKSLATDAQFIWNAPFFNITLPTSDLSMAIKTLFSAQPFISSGSRPGFDVANARRMLLVNNHTGRASVQDFDADIFVGSASGDQGLEGFAPDVAKNDNASGATARLFIGVMPNKQELVIYCSQSATVGEASRALTLAGVPVENQLQADGGGSASCGYNLPGQYFVEPSRTLPVTMGAFTVVVRGVPSTDGINVRSGPGTKYAIVTKLSKNTPIVVLAEKNGWYRIGEGQWILKTLLKK
jgi:rhodanese-related sulfurtransferase